MYDMKLPVGQSMPSHHVYDRVIECAEGGEGLAMYEALLDWSTLCHNRYQCRFANHLSRMVHTTIDMSYPDLHFTYDTGMDAHVRESMYVSDKWGEVRHSRAHTYVDVQCFTVSENV